MRPPLDSELLAFLFWLHDSTDHADEHRSLIEAYIRERS